MSDDQMMNGLDPVSSEETIGMLPEAPVSQRRNGAVNVWLVTGAAVVLIAIVGIVAWVVLSAQAAAPLAVTSAPNVPITGSPGGAVTTTSSSTPTGAVPAIPDVTNSDIFTPRNPFVVIAPPKIASTTSSSSNDNALALTDIVTQDGVKKAVVSYKGKSYTVGEGDTIDSSSYKVVKINSSSVKFLFGDSAFTLSLGQGTSK